MGFLLCKGTSHHPSSTPSPTTALATWPCAWENGPAARHAGQTCPNCGLCKSQWMEPALRMPRGRGFQAPSVRELHGVAHQAGLQLYHPWAPRNCLGEP